MPFGLGALGGLAGQVLRRSDQELHDQYFSARAQGMSQMQQAGLAQQEYNDHLEIYKEIGPRQAQRFYDALPKEFTFREELQKETDEWLRL